MSIIVTRRLDERAPAFYTRNSSQAVFIHHVGENLYYCFSNGYWIPSLPITMESADLIRNLKHHPDGCRRSNWPTACRLRRRQAGMAPIADS
jgi:hypothetical protein